MSLGLVVGKFYPPHKGHTHLIHTARRQVDRLVVLLPHHRSQAIPGDLRKAWLEEIHPHCRVDLVPDTLGDDYAAWAQFIVEHLGRPPDVVFSSEDYGPRFAALMNCRHVMVDRDRATVPISATAIRAAPLDHLDWLEPVVRAHVVRRVVMIGAESTGKTTLSELLAAHYHTSWNPEYAREHWERKIAGLDPSGPLPGWTDDEFIDIATQQQRREDALARTANRLLICDTNAFATGTWFERYHPGQRHAVVDAIGAQDRVHLYLLTHPDIPFVQDGVRDGEKIRHWMHARFLEQLEARPTPFVYLTGTIDDRMRTAVGAVDDLLRSPFVW